MQNQPDMAMEEAEELAAARTSKSSPRGFLAPRKAKKPRWVYNLPAIKKDVNHFLDPISEDLGLTQEHTTTDLRVAWESLLANQYILQDSLTAHTERFVEVPEDLINELEAGELRTNRLEDDVGGRTAESGTRSLVKLSAATEGGIDIIDNLCTSLSIEVGELRAAVETAVGDT
jgi:hypothetical protein